MMHICYLTGLYSRKDPLIFDRQGKALAMAGYKVTIVVCDLEPNETIDGIELISCNYNAMLAYREDAECQEISL